MAENRELALVLKLVADNFQQELKKSGGLVGEFQKFVSDWRTQLTLAGTALFAIAKSTADFGEEALKTSQRIGLTVEKTTALQYAAGLADVPVQTLEKGLQTLAQRAVEAAHGSGEGARLFASLGVSATDTAGKVKPLDQLLFELQDRLKGVGNQAEFVDAGVAAFGKGFRELVPLLRSGSEATKAAMEEGRRLGVVLSKDQAEAASRFNDELKKLDAQVNGVKLSVGNALIPTIRELIELFRTLGVGTGLSGGLTQIQDHLIRLTVLFKELQAGSQFLFGTGKDALTFGQLRERIHGIEAGGQQQLFELRHPGVLTGKTSATGGPVVPPSGGASLIAPPISSRQSNEAGAIQEGLGRWINQVEQQRQAAVAAAASASAAEEAAIQEGLGRWINQVEQQRQAAVAAAAEANKSFFERYADGFRKYITDTQSGFGLAADMARRTAQTMEQGFRTFFFDVMEGKVKSLKDMFSGMLQFVKQIMAQVMAQLAMQGLMKLGSMALSGWGGGAGSSMGKAFNVDGSPIKLGAAGGGEVIRRFAMGGPVLGAGNLDTVPALLTPGEVVLSRQDVSEIKRGLVGGSRGSLTVNVINPGREEQPAVNVRQQMEGMVIDIIFRDVQRNGPLRRLMQGA